MKSGAAASFRQNINGLVALARLSNLPTIVTNCLAGISLAHPAVLSRPGEWGPVCLGLCALYCAGMILNDLCDRQTDAAEKPGRPLPSGRVSIKTAWIVTALLFPAGILLAGRTPEAMACVLLLSGLIVAYDVFHKGNPAAPLLMGLCRSCVYLVGGYAVSAETSMALTDVLSSASITASPWIPAALLGLTVACITWIAAGEADAEHRPPALPGGTLAISMAFMAVISFPDPFAFSAALLLLGWTLFSLSLAYRKNNTGGAARATAHLLAGICLFDAVFIFHAGQNDYGFAALALFVVTLIAHRRVRGT